MNDNLYTDWLAARRKPAPENSDCVHAVMTSVSPQSEIRKLAPTTSWLTALIERADTRQVDLWPAGLSMAAGGIRLAVTIFLFATA